MGNSCSSSKAKDVGEDGDAIMEAYKDEKEHEIVMQTDRTEVVPHAQIIEHYLPVTFPITPELRVGMNESMRQSWNYIQDTPRELAGQEVSGIVYFYDSFFKRLFDRSRRFEKDFPDAKTKGTVLVKVMDLCCSFSANNIPQIDRRVADLARYHLQKDIRPWQYAVYAETLLITIAHCLGDKADNNNVGHWINVLAYVLKGMATVLIRPEFVLMTEGVFNTETQFDDAEKMDQLAELKRVRIVEKRMRQARQKDSRENTRRTNQTNASSVASRALHLEHEDDIKEGNEIEA